jgi:hypothetical protein
MSNHQEALTAWYQSETERDHHEANLANYFYHQFERDGLGNVQVAALDAAEAELAPTILHADRFGYTVASNAWRRLRHSEAHLAAMEEYYSESWDSTRLAIRKHELAVAAEALKKGDPNYFGLYDWLERERVKRDRFSLKPLDPINQEHAYAAGVLANAIDEIALENPATIERGKKFEHTMIVEPIDERLRARVEYYRTLVALCYKLTVSPKTEDPNTDDVERHSRTYVLEDRTAGMHVICYDSEGAEPVNTDDLLTLADSFSPNEALIFDRDFKKPGFTVTNRP